MQRSSFFVLVTKTALVLAFAACGNEITNTHDAAGTTGSGAGGATTTTSTTGNVTATVSTGTTSSSSGTGGASCGGKVGVPCGAGEYCHFGPDAACGNFDATGTCLPKPQACDPDCPGVCGCDGKFYCNECGANLSGVDISGETACKASDSYAAVSLVTNVPRFAILKASPTRNLCFRLILVASQSTGIGISGDGFTVQDARVTHDIDDCKILGSGPLPLPMGAMSATMSGSGVLSIGTPSTGCVAGIHAKLVFPGAAPWVPPTEPLDADGLVILGGCP